MEHLRFRLSVHVNNDLENNVQVGRQQAVARRIRRLNDVPYPRKGGTVYRWPDGLVLQRVYSGEYRIFYIVHAGELRVLGVRPKNKHTYKNLDTFRPRYDDMNTQDDATVPPLPTIGHYEASSRDRDAGPQELELERLFRQLLPDTRFANKVFAVGGYVRDQLQGLEPADLDMVVELPYGAQRFAGFLLKRFPDSITDPEPLTYDFPIWRQWFTKDVEYLGELYRVQGAEIDLTDSHTLERLNGTETSRFGPLQQDVNRRDFTVNMLFKDLTTGDLLDPTGTGQHDIEQGVLHGLPTQDAQDSFRYNPRQMLRLIRFMAQYGWSPDSTTEQALRTSIDHLAELSRSTVEREFQKWQARGVLDKALQLLRRYNALEPLRRAAQNRDAVVNTTREAPRDRPSTTPHRDAVDRDTGPARPTRGRADAQLSPASGNPPAARPADRCRRNPVGTTPTAEAGAGSRQGQPGTGNKPMSDPKLRTAQDPPEEGPSEFEISHPSRHHWWPD